MKTIYAIKISSVYNNYNWNYGKIFFSYKEALEEARKLEDNPDLLDFTIGVEPLYVY